VRAFCICIGGTISLGLACRYIRPVHAVFSGRIFFLCGAKAIETSRDANVLKPLIAQQGN
jgi:hypothetical protein